MSPLAVGLTIVAFGTSAPELVVSLDAALKGSSDIAVGNVVGSNICNVALILGVSALVRPIVVNAKIFRIDAPALICISVGFAAMLFFAGGVTRLLGALLLTALIVYVSHTLGQAKRETPRVAEQFSAAIPAQRASLAKSVAFVLAGLLGLAVGGNLLVSSAITLASMFAVSEAVIGLTIVAVGTSLPELATSVVAAARGKGDIAVGNVVGSNIFNILGIIGTTAVVRPLAQGNIDWGSIFSMILLAVVLLPIARTGFVVSRMEGSLLALFYAGYIGWLLAGWK